MRIVACSNTNHLQQRVREISPYLQACRSSMSTKIWGPYIGMRRLSFRFAVRPSSAIETGLLRDLNISASVLRPLQQGADVQIQSRHASSSQMLGPKMQRNTLQELAPAGLPAGCLSLHKETDSKGSRGVTAHANFSAGTFRI